METAIIIFHIHKEHRTDINNCYLKAQNPIMLLKGNRTLKEFGVRNGTIISMAE